MKTEQSNKTITETITEEDLSFELNLTDEEGHSLGTVEVPVITNSDLICYLIKSTERGVKIRPIIE